MTLYDCECSSVKSQYNEIIAPDILMSSGAVESLFLQIQSKLLPTVVSPGIQKSKTHIQIFFLFFFCMCGRSHTQNRAWLPSGAEASSAESDYLSFRRVATSEEKLNLYSSDKIRNTHTECCFLARGPKGVFHACDR